MVNDRTPATFSGRLMSMSPLILFSFLALGILGIMMQYSAAGGEMLPWAKPQAVRFGMGLAAFVFMAAIPMWVYMRLAYPFYLLCLSLLMVVEVAGFIGMGAQRWISLGSVNLQPSEFMKLALILALSRYFHMVRREDINHFMMLIPPVIMIALPAMLILRQPNLGTATILCFIGFMMAFIAGLRWQYFATILICGIIAVPVGWQFLHDYQKRRVETFLDPSQDPLGAGYNITQSIIAIGSGGLVGQGYLQGSQGQLDFLPEKQTDFIFTMVAEELGFIGSIMVLLLFATLIGYGLALIIRPKSRFASLVATGVTALLFIHVLINVGMVMGLLPVVGVPLPFLSYGGTFLLAACMAIGLLMNAYIHRDAVLHRNIRGLI